MAKKLLKKVLNNKNIVYVGLVKSCFEEEKQHTKFEQFKWTC